MSDQTDATLNPDNDPLTGRTRVDLPRDLKLLEAQLAALVPRDDRLDRERLAFLAGQASVDANTRRRVALLGAQSDATIWPWAFAAMTSVAASLLFLLLTRPSLPELQLPAPPGDLAGTDRQIDLRDQPPAATGDKRIDVLVVSDIRGGDIEQILTRQRDELAGKLPVDDRPALTPTAWRRLTGDCEASEVPAGESSSVRIYRGVRS